MGDKHDNKSKHGKKLTAKEKKAQNHLKLMQGAKDKNATGAVEATNNFNKDKKAA
jgi:hypothetical protein